MGSYPTFSPLPAMPFGRLWRLFSVALAVSAGCRPFPLGSMVPCIAPTFLLNLIFPGGRTHLFSVFQRTLLLQRYNKYWAVQNLNPVVGMNCYLNRSIAILSKRSFAQFYIFIIFKSVNNSRFQYTITYAMNENHFCIVV